MPLSGSNRTLERWRKWINDHKVTTTHYPPTHHHPLPTNAPKIVRCSNENKGNWIEKTTKPRKERNRSIHSLRQRGTERDRNRDGKEEREREGERERGRERGIGRWRQWDRYRDRNRHRQTETPRQRRGQRQRKRQGQRQRQRQRTGHTHGVVVE